MKYRQISLQPGAKLSANKKMIKDFRGGCENTEKFTHAAVQIGLHFKETQTADGAFGNGLYAKELRVPVSGLKLEEKMGRAKHFPASDRYNKVMSYWGKDFGHRKPCDADTHNRTEAICFVFSRLFNWRTPLTHW